MNKYPLTLNAVKTNDHSQWDIGDALIKECGPPSESGSQDGSMTRLNEAAQYLVEEGYAYTVKTLSEFRVVAFNFKSAERRLSLAWGTHLKARTPEFLKAVIAGAPKGTRISQNYVEGIRAQIIDQQRREREEAEEKAQAKRRAAEKEEAEARERERSAKTKKEKEEAQAEREQAEAKTKQAKIKEQEVKTAPKKKVTPPAEDEVPILAIRANFIADAARSVVLARESVKAIKNRMHELTPKAITAMNEAAIEAANAWTEAARIVRTELVNESGHLSVVGE